MDWDSAWKKELTSRETGTVNWRPEGREPVPEEELRKAEVERDLQGARTVA